MTNRLTVHTATVHTATIEVKTLTLNGKQVTLSVFRQLQEEPLLSNGALPLCLRGVGWGWVNYCPGSATCAWARQGVWPHRHLVWQLGDELRRCPLPPAPIRSGTDYFTLCARESWPEIDALDLLPQLFIAV